MDTIEILKAQTVPYRPNRYRRQRAAFFWGVAAGLVLAWGLVLVGRAYGQTAPPADSSTLRLNRQIDQNWNREMDRQQRERFHEDYEADRRVYGVNPDGRDAQSDEDGGGDDD